MWENDLTKKVAVRHVLIYIITNLLRYLNFSQSDMNVMLHFLCDFILDNHSSMMI